MSDISCTQVGTFIKAVITRADGSIKDLGYHSYSHTDPWKAVLLEHNDREKDQGLREYWNKNLYNRIVLQIRLASRRLD